MGRKTGVILSYAMMVFEILSTLLLTPFIFRNLGQAEFGVFKLCASVNAYFFLLDLGVGNAVIRYIAKYRANKDKELEQRFLGVVTIFYLFIAMLIIITGGVLIEIFPDVFAKGLTDREIVLGQKLLAITMVNTAVTLGTTAYNNVIIAYERFAISKGFSIVQIMLRIILTFVVLNLGMKSFGIVLVNLIMTVICRLAYVVYVFFCLKLRPSFKNIKFSFIKEIIGYSSFILLQMIATQINAFADQIMIGIFVTSSSAIIGIYSVGTQIVQYFQSIGSSFNGVLMPGIVKMIEKGSTPSILCNEMARIGRIIMIVLGGVWCNFLVFGKQFIYLWLGEKNQMAYYVAIVLMTVYVFILTEAIGTQILWAKNEHKEQALLKFFIVLLNVFLTVILIKWNPLIGALIGTFISLALGDVLVMNIIFVKKLGISLKHYYFSLLKGILPCIIISIIIGSIIKSFNLTGWIGFLMNLVIVSAAYVAVLWKIGMNRYEKNLVKSLLKWKHRNLEEDNV